MSKLPFIKCSDEDTICKLRKLGFEEISKDGNVVTFLNNAKMTFDETNTKVTYSRMLTI